MTKKDDNQNSETRRLTGPDSPFDLGGMVETMFGIDEHYETCITDKDKNKYTGRGTTSEVSQKEASKKYDSGNSDSKPCCYLTTACLEAKGISLEDSIEFNSIKELTRNHILKSFSGRRDYITYGRIAPKIVDVVKSRNDAMTIWDSVYERLKETSNSIVSGKMEEGHQIYKKMVNDMKEVFL